MFMFVLNILCHNLLGTNRPEGWVRTDRKAGTKRLSLGTNRLGTKRLNEYHTLSRITEEI